METPETPLEMAERHVREDKERLAHQERLASEVDRIAYPEMGIVADKLVDEFRRVLRLGREHVDRLRNPG